MSGSRVESLAASPAERCALYPAIDDLAGWSVGQMVDSLGVALFDPLIGRCAGRLDMRWGDIFNHWRIDWVGGGLSVGSAEYMAEWMRAWRNTRPTTDVLIEIRND